MRGTLCFCAMLLIASAATVHRAKAYALFPFSGCYHMTENYEASIAYKQSVYSVLLAMRSNASLTGFAAAVAGQPPNRAYGAILCYADASSEDCRTCISNATQGTDSSCGSFVLWHDHCMVRYSPSNVIDALGMTFLVGGANPDSLPASDPALFNQQLLVLLSNLTATATANQSAMEYAAGNILVTAGQTIHGLVQCTRDISLNDCRSCLANLTTMIQTCCNEKTDVFISSATCIIKYRVPELASSSSSARVGLHWTRSGILAAMISTLWMAALCL